MSLYTLYRPKVFADVAGQEHIVSTLEQAVKQDKLAHAYLFAGSRGTGKTSVARILAKALLTRGIADEKLCGQIVKSVEDNSLVDLTEIDAASNRGIDDIRNLLEKIQFSPVVATAKVYIIDEVHMLTKEAFNALLKTLEEPPPYAYFLLATTELHKIPLTIQSRCQRFLFRQIREEDIIRRLQYIADQEHITVERTALRAIAHHVQGSLRDAISLLDQLRSLENITLADIHQRIGETGHEYVEQVLAALQAKDTGTLLGLVQRMEEMAVPLETFVRLLLGNVRMQLHSAIEQKQDTGELLRILDTLLRTVRDLRIAPVPGLVLESALLSLCYDTVTVSSAPVVVKKPAVIARDVTPPASIESPAAPTAEKTTEAAAPMEAPSLSHETLEEKWPEILKEIDLPAVRMSMKNAHVAGIDGSTITVSFASAYNRDKVSNTEASRAIEAIMERIFKRQVRLKCTLETEEHVKTTADESVVNLAEAAAEIF
ncbi:DNA polymerase III subunit gamma/tau [Candidatus Peregrinibacteria bacterium]|nr:DNA polymerase III subunit gamma/tau [Candidatus Peregrinibacteria bacterium]